MRPPIPTFYSYVRILSDWFFSNNYDFSTSGMENVPLEGSVIFAANHVSFFDPPAIGCQVYRHINYFARDTLFTGGLGKALHKLEAIPVARENADVASLKAIFRSLKKQGAIAIYPEGTRSPTGELMEPKAGAGMIACKSRATVVPTRLFGTYEVFGRNDKLPKLGGAIHIAYGKPMTTAEIDPGKDHPERYLEASRRIMERITALKAPDYVVI
ncbi:MAG: lysophospholipid acyltransferase family protein [Opitutaceae bacterium]